MRQASTPSWKLALRAGLPQATILSAIIHAERVVASPQTVARLERPARIIAFERSILADEIVREAVAS